MFLSCSTKTRASGGDAIKDLSHFCQYKMLLIVYALAELIDGVGMCLYTKRQTQDTNILFTVTC